MLSPLLLCFLYSLSLFRVNLSLLYLYLGLISIVYLDPTTLVKALQKENNFAGQIPTFSQTL